MWVLFCVAHGLATRGDKLEERRHNGMRDNVSDSWQRDKGIPLHNLDQEKNIIGITLNLTLELW